MHYHPGSFIDELQEYSSPDAWVIFVPSSKKTLLYPPVAKKLVDAISASDQESIAESELLEAISKHDTGGIIPEELLSSLVKAGILACR